MKVLFILSTLFILKAFTQQCSPSDQDICNKFANEYRMHTCDLIGCCADGYFDEQNDGVYECTEDCSAEVTEACTEFLNANNKFTLCGYTGGPNADCELETPPTKA